MNPASLPESIREEYGHKYSDKPGAALKLPLFATFNALQIMGREVGRAFFEKADEIKQILSARNDSVLAHGTTPVSQETYEKFHHLIVNELLRETPITFPKLEW